MATCLRRVIRITALDSPNVRLALAEQERGLQPSGREVVPGVLSWAEYQYRRATWDPIRQTIGLDAQFYVGKEVMLYPNEWLERAARLDEALRGRVRKARAIGIDPAEGGDKTAMCAVDEFGVIELTSKRTPDTSVVVHEAIAFLRRHGVDPEDVVFDRGGGGKQHADRLRSMRSNQAPRGYNVRTVAFGESLVLEPKRGLRRFDERKEIYEEKYEYVNRRAQMYHEVRQLIDPANDRLGQVEFGRIVLGRLGGEVGWAISRGMEELRRQMGPIPLLYDEEGRIRMLPKRRKDPEQDVKTLEELIGCSPDELDALVLAVHGMVHKGQRQKAGAVG